MRQEDRTFLHISIPCEVQRRPRAACLSRCSGPPQPPHGPPKWSPLICARHDSRKCNSTEGGKGSQRTIVWPKSAEDAATAHQLLFAFNFFSSQQASVRTIRQKDCANLLLFTRMTLTHGKLFNIGQAFLRWFHDKTPFVVEKMKSSPLALSTIHSFCLIFCLNGL